VYLQQREELEVGSEVQHQPVLDVQQHISAKAEGPNQRVQRVAARDPFNEARVGREGDHAVPAQEITRTG